MWLVECWRGQITARARHDPKWFGDFGPVTLHVDIDAATSNVSGPRLRIPPNTQDLLLVMETREADTAGAVSPRLQVHASKTLAQQRRRSLLGSIILDLHSFPMPLVE